jgi:hypothetical protein
MSSSRKGGPVIAGVFLLAALLLNASTATALDPIQLVPAIDSIGQQIATVQVYNSGDGKGDRITYGIYDTGASVVTYGYQDLDGLSALGQSIGVKVADGAQASGLGGVLIGDVSVPGTVTVVGMSGVDVDFDFNSPTFLDTTIKANAEFASVAGIQAFLGNATTSANLPTITGTPMHAGGMAARIDMIGYGFDLGELFPELGIEIVIPMPDVTFHTSGAVALSGDPGSFTDPVSAPVRIPMDLFGDDNVASPGDQLSFSYNPVQPNVSFTHNPGSGDQSVSGKKFLFDTGAQMNIVSEEIILALGRDPNTPDTTLDIQGAAGQADQVKGFVIDKLELPADTNFDGTADDVLTFLDTTVFMLDLGFEIDGVLGMSLMNSADQLLYDPHDPLGASVSMTFDLDRDTSLGTFDASLLALLASDPEFSAAFGGALGTGTAYPNFNVIPEPSAGLLFALGMLVAFGSDGRRRVR